MKTIAATIALIACATAQNAATAPSTNPLADAQAFLTSLVGACPLSATTCGVIPAFNSPIPAAKLDALICVSTYPAVLESAECLKLQEPLVSMLPPGVVRVTLPEIDATKVPDELKQVVEACPALVYNCEYYAAVESGEQVWMRESTECLFGPVGHDELLALFPENCGTALVAADKEIAARSEEKPTLTAKAVESVKEECKSVATLCLLEDSIASADPHYQADAVMCMAKYPAKFVSEKCQAAMKPLVALVSSTPVERVEAVAIDQAVVSPELKDMVLKCESLAFSCQLAEAYASEQPLAVASSAKCMLYTDVTTVDADCATAITGARDIIQSKVQARLTEVEGPEMQEQESKEEISEEQQSVEDAMGGLEEPSSTVESVEASQEGSDESASADQSSESASEDADQSAESASEDADESSTEEVSTKEVVEEVAPVSSLKKIAAKIAKAAEKKGN